MTTPRSTAAKRRLQRKAGYSLLEILIVVSIIALIATLVGPQLLKLMGGAQSKTAMTQMKGLKETLGIMQVDIGRFPTEQEGLNLLVQAPGEGVPNWNGPYLSQNTVPNDPWGQPYRYVPSQGEEGPKIASYGKDNKEGGSGENADIVI